MKYIEGYELVKAGKHIKREAWDHVDNVNVRLFLIPESPMVWVIQKSANVAGGINCGGYSLTVEDMEANDWVEVSSSWNDLHVEKTADEVTVSEPSQVM